MSPSRLLAVLAFVLTTLGCATAATAGEADSASAGSQTELSAADKICMAKMVMHEAGNQSKLGQMAVAQVVLNRLATGRFGRTVCAVIDQPGQFFKVASYRPSMTSLQWRMAQAVAETALDAENRAVVAGALFFNVTRARAAWRGRRVLLAEIGDHSFYR